MTTRTLVAITFVGMGVAGLMGFLFGLMVAYHG
jgi:hypothetical protein